MFEALLIVLSIIFFLAFFFFLSRKSSIVGIPARNRHFRRLATDLEFEVQSDEYFIALRGAWKDHPVMIYPHNFEGPGSITMFYADSGVPFIEGSWVEPTVSLGRALVLWKNHRAVDFDFAGNTVMKQYPVVEALERYKPLFPFLAITQPGRLLFSQLVHDAFMDCRNFIVLVILDSKRTPPLDEIKLGLNAAVDLSDALKTALVETEGSNNGTRPK